MLKSNLELLLFLFPDILFLHDDVCLFSVYSTHYCLSVSSSGSLNLFYNEKNSLLHAKSFDTLLEFLNYVPGAIL